MTPFPPELEALMPEPVAKVLSWTCGSYSRNYKLQWIGDAREGEQLFTADQVRQAMLGVKEWAAKKCDEQAEYHQDFKNTQAAIGCDGCAAAIRGGGQG